MIRILAVPRAVEEIFTGEMDARFSTGGAAGEAGDTEAANRTKGPNMGAS